MPKTKKNLKHIKCFIKGLFIPLLTTFFATNIILVWFLATYWTIAFKFSRNSQEQVLEASHDPWGSISWSFTQLYCKKNTTHKGLELFSTIHATCVFSIRETLMHISSCLVAKTLIFPFSELSQIDFGGDHLSNSVLLQHLSIITNNGICNDLVWENPLLAWVCSGRDLSPFLWVLFFLQWGEILMHVSSCVFTKSLDLPLFEIRPFNFNEYHLGRDVFT
jgi:hypothetical protein